MLKKSNQIKLLNLRLSQLKPKRNFESEFKWDNIRISALSKIWIFLTSNINNENDNSSLIKLNYNGCPLYGSHLITPVLKNALFDISNNNLWSENKSTEIIFNMNSMIDSLIQADDNNLLVEMLPLQKSFFIFNMIENILGNGFDGGLLDGIPQFLCARCLKRTDYIRKTCVLCFECSTIADKISNLTKEINKNFPM